MEHKFLFVKGFAKLLDYLGPNFAKFCLINIES